MLEHLAFVKANPALFGLAKKQTAGWTREDRDYALRLVLRSGWIRVRDGTLETWNLTSTAVRNIKGFLRQIKAWPEDPVRVTEHREQIVLRTTAALFLGKASGVFAHRKKLLENAVRTIRNIRTVPTNPFSAPTVVSSSLGDVTIDVPASPTVLPNGQVFVPVGLPCGTRMVHRAKVVVPAAPVRHQVPRHGARVIRRRKVARTALQHARHSHDLLPPWIRRCLRRY